MEVTKTFENAGYYIFYCHGEIFRHEAMDELEYKLGCADLGLTSCSQVAPGGGLLLVLVACKIIYCTFVEGKTITGLRSSASIGCTSLGRQDYPAPRSQESLDLGLCLRSHITHICRIRLFKTN